MNQRRDVARTVVDMPETCIRGNDSQNQFCVNVDTDYGFAWCCMESLQSELSNHNMKLLPVNMQRH